MIRVEHQGDFKGLTKWLNDIKFKKVESVLKKYGERGVQALMSATPKDTGKRHHIVISTEQSEISRLRTACFARNDRLLVSPVS